MITPTVVSYMMTPTIETGHGTDSDCHINMLIESRIIPLNSKYNQEVRGRCHITAGALPWSQDTKTNPRIKKEEYLTSGLPAKRAASIQEQQGKKLHANQTPSSLDARKGQTGKKQAERSVAATRCPKKKCTPPMLLISLFD